MYRFAIIGCGSVAEIHVQHILKIGELVAFCDVIPERANSFAERFNANPYYTIDHLLLNEKKIAIVCICSPTGYHAEHAIKSLQSGKHVICESPLCLTSAAVWQIIEIQKFSRRKMTVVHANFNSRSITLLKDRIAGKQNFTLECAAGYSKHHYSGWRGKYFPAGGMLYNEFSQPIEILISLFGKIDEAICKSGKAIFPEIEIDDHGQADLKFDSGTNGQVLWQALNKVQDKKISLVINSGAIPLIEKDLDIEYDAIYHSFVACLSCKDYSSNILESGQAIQAIEKIYKFASQILPV